MRLRVLELPAETVGEVSSSPFVLVFDRIESADLDNVRTSARDKATLDATGARGVLVFADDVELG